ncbi:hypothetical protein VCV18_005273 [Metarhizium anisopliae]
MLPRPSHDENSALQHLGPLHFLLRATASGEMGRDDTEPSPLIPQTKLERLPASPQHRRRGDFSTMGQTPNNSHLG